MGPVCVGPGRHWKKGVTSADLQQLLRSDRRSGHAHAAVRVHQRAAGAHGTAAAAAAGGLAAAHAGALQAGGVLEAGAAADRTSRVAPDVSTSKVTPCQTSAAGSLKLMARSSWLKPERFCSFSLKVGAWTTKPDAANPPLIAQRSIVGRRRQVRLDHLWRQRRLVAWAAGVQRHRGQRDADHGNMPCHTDGVQPLLHTLNRLTLTTRAFHSKCRSRVVQQPQGRHAAVEEQCVLSAHLDGLPCVLNGDGGDLVVLVEPQDAPLDDFSCITRTKEVFTARLRAWSALERRHAALLHMMLCTSACRQLQPTRTNCDSFVDGLAHGFQFHS